MNDMSELPELPWSPEAEAGVVGAVLMKNDLLDQVADIIRADHFHDPAIGRVFDALAQMIFAGKPADSITVMERLRQSSKDGGIDLQWLVGLEHGASTAPRLVRRYAEIIAEKSVSRRFASAADEVRALANEPGPVLDRIGMAQAKLETLQESSTKSDPQPIENFVSGMLDHLQDLADGKVEPGIPTRIPGVDRLMSGGLKPGKQIIQAARPSVGKSSLAEQVALNVSMQGHTAAMFSMEMTCKEMTNRAVANIGRIELDHIEDGKLTDEEWGRLAEATEKLKNLPLFFDEQPALTLQDIAAKARKLKRRHNLKLLVIDYIQLCGTTNPKLSRHHQLEEISRGLKSLAKQLEITILTLSQLNRDIEKRTNGRPVLSDLKESGAIEEDADVVMLLWCEQERSDSSLMGLDLAKNRQGKKGIVPLQFEGHFQRWRESTQQISTAAPATKARRGMTDHD